MVSTISETAEGMIVLVKIGFTFFVVCIGWVFFRADSLSQAFEFLNCFFRVDSFDLDFFTKQNRYFLTFIICLISILTVLIIEFIHVVKKEQELKFSNKIVVLLLFMIFFLGSFKNQLDFIYFQF